MYILSKIINYFASPLTWVLISSLCWLFLNNKKLKNIFGIVSLLLLTVFSNTFLFRWVHRIWEVPTINKSQIENYQVGIVLGGMFVYDDYAARLSLLRGGDRLWQALDLYYSGKIQKLMITSGETYGSEKSLYEANEIKKVLLNWGIPDEDLIVESKSINTYENALYSAEILRKSYWEGSSCLLITSAVHMRRALACFDKQGIHAIPYSTNAESEIGSPYTWMDILVPSINTFQLWYKFNNEWIGYLSYKLLGRI